MSLRTPALMIQGTGTNVGKSTLVAGLARAFVRRGLRVMPFKPQNMSNNAAVTQDGGEIGRAQALQARAARVPPTVHMNPVLLKPESGTGAQLILRGQRAGRLHSSGYADRRARLLPEVLDSFRRLEGASDLVLVEGAGSAAEVNLRAGDIANMGFAVPAEVPVVLLGDIDRGGVIASLVGTHALLPEAERSLVRGFAVNKFRGDLRLFESGIAVIEERTGWPSMGTLPWLPQTAWLPSEDGADLERRQAAGSDFRVAVPLLPGIANFDDLDPLRAEAGVTVEFVRPGRPLPSDARLIVLAGSKTTVSDLSFMRGQGWDIDLHGHVRRGGCVLGICGGFQMLGRSISDPAGIEGPAGTVEGLGLLEVDTVLETDKHTTPVRGTHLASGQAIKGYEIHLGRTEGPDRSRPVFDLGGRPDGAHSADGLVQGTYVHGAFGADGFRHAYLRAFGKRASARYEAGVEGALEALADHVEANLDLDRLLAIARAR